MSKKKIGSIFLTMILAVALVIGLMLPAGNAERAYASDSAGTWIYVDGTNGNDSNDGSSAGSAVQSWDKAKDLLGCDEGGIIVVGTVKAEGDIYTKDPSKQTVKRESDIVMFEASGTVNFISIDVDGGADKGNFNNPVIEAKGGSTISYLNGAVFHNTGYDPGPQSSPDKNAVGGMVTSLFEEHVKIIVDGATFKDNNGLGIFFTPMPVGGIAGTDNVSVYVKSTTVKDNKCYFYHNESTQGSNKLYIYNALVRNNDASGMPQKFTSYTGRTGVIYICDVGTLGIRSTNGLAAFDNSEYDLMWMDALDIENKGRILYGDFASTGDYQNMYGGGVTYELPGYMPGGGSPNYKTTDNYNEGWYWGVTSNPSQEDKDKAVAVATSVFENNQHTLIDSNGRVYFGTGHDDDTPDTPKVTIDQTCDNTPTTTPKITNTTASANGTAASSSVPAEVTITSGDSVTITDSVEFADLAENVEYTIKSELWSQGSVQQTQTTSVTSKTASPVTVTFNNVSPTAQQQFNVKTILLKGSEELDVHNSDRNTPSERVVVKVTEPSEPGGGTDDSSSVNVTIKKVDENGNCISGAELHIEDANGKTVVQKWTSTNEAKEITLDEGTYYLVEDKAPNGYVRKTEKKKFEVKATTLVSPTADSNGDPKKLPDFRASNIYKPQQGVIENLNISKANTYGFGADAFSGQDTNGDGMPADVPVFCIEPNIGVNQVDYQLIGYNQDYFDNFLAHMVGDGHFGGEIPNSERLLRVAYVGASGDGLGYSSRAKDTDEFRRATQQAIWKVSANKDPEYMDSDSENYKKLVSDLIDAADDDSIVIPAYDARLLVQKPHETSVYYSQPFMVVTFANTPGAIQPITVELENTKEEEETELAKIKIVASKELSGSTAPELSEVADEFEFILTGTDVDQPVKKNNAADGTITFGEFTLSEAKKYSYKIVETKGENSDITYFSGSRNLNVTTKLEGNKVVVDTVEMGDKTKPAVTTEDGVTTITFDNKHTFLNTYAEPGMVQTTVKKIWENADGTDTWPEGKTVTFKVQYGTNAAETIELTEDEPGKSTQQYTEVENAEWTVTEVSETPGYDKGKVEGNYEDGFSVTNTQKTFPVTINKTDLGDGSEVEGATIEVYDSEGTVIKTWESKENEVCELKLTEGDYSFKETVKPDGYQQVTTEIKFSVDADGNVNVTTTTVDGGGEVSVSQGAITLADAPEETEPSIGTVATDLKDGDKYLNSDGTVTVKDVVTYENLVPGKTYTMKGELHKKSDGQNGKAIAEASQAFTPAENGDGSGTVELTFTVSAADLKGEALVAFEYAKDGETEVASHADINDEKQTVYVPELATTATDSETEDHIANADDSVTIKDVVDYKGLIAGKEYTMSGQLIKKSDGTTVLAEASETFTAAQGGAGTVTLTFTVDASELAGDSAVAFETCKDGDTVVAVHKDINDEDQTVNFPEAETNATDKEDGDQTVKPLKTVTVVDKVTYKNLIPGKEYTVKGTLYDKATGNACTFDGAEAEKKFTADTADGFVELEFVFDASELEGKTMVAFEKVEYNGNVVATHEDLTDPDQTVNVKGEKVKVTVKKTWDGEPASELKVQLKKNGQNEGAEVTLKASDNWTKTWNNLPKEDENGKQYKYEVTETVPDGYTRTVSKSTTDTKGNVTAEFTNTKTTTPPGPVTVPVKVTVEKTWKGDAPESISVQLMKDGVKEGAAVKLTAADNWTYNWTDLVKGSVYTVEETAPDGYIQTAASTATDTSGNVTVKFENTKVEGKIATTVEAGGKFGTKNTAATLTAKEAKEVTEVIDHISYTGLVKDATYKVTGELMEIGEDGSTTKIAEKSENLKADGKTPWTITFTNVNLKPDTKYVVFETAVNTKAPKDKAEHKQKDDQSQTIVVEKTEVKINKTDLGGTEIEGAKIKVTDSKGETVKEWTSKKNETMDMKLAAGEYTLTEVNAPEGYICVTTEIKFTVKEDGTVEVTTKKAEPAGAIEQLDDGTIILKDALEEYPVKINKTDLGGKEIEGAVIKVTGKNANTGEEVNETWTSKKDEVMELNLPAGDYEFVEENAPEGYQKVTTTIKFTVNMDGTVTVNTTTVDPAGAIEQLEDGTIILKDALEETPKGAPAPAYATIEANKTLTGKTLTDGEFTFTLKGSGQNQTEKNAGGKVTFEKIKYDKAGTYTYTVAETAGNDANITYDASTKDVTVTVVLDETDNKLKIDGVTEVTKNAGTFTNKYNKPGTEPAKVTITAKKVLTVVRGTKTLEADAFVFSLEGTGITGKQYTTNAADGSITFPAITYTEAGTYEYTVKELNGNETNVTYDNTVKNVTVNVVEKDGKLLIDGVSEATKDAGTFTNTYEEPETPPAPVPEYVSVTVNKVWNDSEDQDGKRPANVDVILYADGEVCETVTLNSSNKWTYTWTKLAKNNAAGNVITYTVQEKTVPAGYEASVNGTIITNTHAPETVDITGTKTWNDNNNQDGKRPASIEVDLYANGVYKATDTVTEAEGWIYKFTELPKYEKGKEITYTVAEKAVADYSAEYNGNNIVNSYTPETTSVSVVKVWDDENDKDGIRPESISVVLRGSGGNTGKSAVLNAANGWSHTFTDLPKKENGNDISYTVIESGVPEGYTSATTGSAATRFVIKNTHVPETPPEEPQNPTVEISKTSTTDTAELPGAKLVITKKGTEDVVASHVSTEETWKVQLEPGEYTLTEITAPDGYEVAESIDFTVDANGLVDSEKVHMEDAPKPEEPENPTVEISKTSTTDTAELPGAKLIITKKGTEDVVAFHTSTNETWKVQLAPGEYTLTEITAPDGYEVAESINFTVDANGLVDSEKVHMEDAPTSEEPENPTVEISKTSTTDAAELPGAKLVITKKGTDEIVAQHTSTDQTWKVQLAPGNYTLTEITAPNGYEVAESIDFTVDANGLVGSDKVHMEDAPKSEETQKPENPTVKISKQDATTSAELPGATLIVRDAQGNKVKEWISESTPKEIQLAPGTYTLTEITAPDGYLRAETIEFTVAEDGLVGSDKVVMLDNKAGNTTVKNQINVDVTADKNWTTEWPEGVSVTFTLEYFAKGEWHTYLIGEDQPYTVTISKGQTATFENIPYTINDEVAKYRVVEAAVEGYNVKEWKGTDLENMDGNMFITNQPNTEGQKTTPGKNTDGEQSNDNEVKKPSVTDNDDKNTNNNNGNTGNNTTGNVTNRNASGTTGSTTPVTTRRAGTYGTSTPTVGSSTATATGDSNNAVLWIVVAAAAAAAIAGAAVVMRRRRHDN